MVRASSALIVSLACTLTLGCPNRTKAADGVDLPRAKGGAPIPESALRVRLTPKELYVGDKLILPFAPAQDFGFAPDQKRRLTITSLQAAVVASPSHETVVVLADKSSPHLAVFEIIHTLGEAGVKDIRLGVSPDGSKVAALAVGNMPTVPSVAFVVDRTELRVVSGLYSSRTFPTGFCVAKKTPTTHDVTAAVECVKKLDAPPRDGDWASLSARADTDLQTVVSILDGVRPTIPTLKMGYACCVEP